MGPQSDGPPIRRSGDEHLFPLTSLLPVSPTKDPAQSDPNSGLREGGITPLTGSRRFIRVG